VILIDQLHLCVLAIENQVRPRLGRPSSLYSFRLSEFKLRWLRGRYVLDSCTKDNRTGTAVGSSDPEIEILVVTYRD